MVGGRIDTFAALRAEVRMSLAGGGKEKCQLLRTAENCDWPGKIGVLSHRKFKSVFCEVRRIISDSSEQSLHVYRYQSGIEAVNGVKTIVFLKIKKKAIV